jgi:hypothetical protein
MPTDREEPWGGATYNGFSGPAPDVPPESAPAARRQWPAFTRNRTLMGGVAGAVVLGLILGVWAHPPLGADSKAHEPTSASAAEAATLPKVPIVLTQPTPPPTVKTAGRLEVLPPDMAAAAKPAPRPPSAPAPSPAPSAEDSAADVAQLDPPQLDRPPPPPLSRAERRALREAPIEAPPPPLSRAERRALRDEPIFVPPPDDYDPAYDDEEYPGY